MFPIIETSQLVCIANQLNGFYMMRNIGREWVNKILHVNRDIKVIFFEINWLKNDKEKQAQGDKGKPKAV